MRKRRFALVLAAAGLCALTLFLARHFSRRGGGPYAHGAYPDPAGTGSEAGLDRAADPALTPGSGARFPAAGQEKTSPLQQRLVSLYARLRAGQAAPEELDEFRRSLLAADPRLAILAIRNFLSSGRDAATQEEFQVGPSGRLQGAPTLRVLLLDLLGQLSKSSGANDGDEIGRQILAGHGSADEWALALRNVGWQEPGATPYLAAKFQEMLGDPAWRAKPTAGYLEAFDVAVFARDPSLTPALANAAHDPVAEIKRAAMVAMDRLSEAAPLAVMNHLNANPAEFSDLPFLRADYFAKADFSDAAQRKALETYLARTDVAAPEKTKLIKELATPGTIVTDVLLSPQAPRPEQSNRQQLVADTLEGWLAANRFPELQLQIRTTLSQMRAGGR